MSAGASFIADVHLGKLARDLRMLGFDTLWSQDYEDSELARLSTEEGRFLLTKDRRLAEQADPKLTLHVKTLSREDQLLEVLRHFGLVERARSGRGFLSRCLDCNAPILPVRGDQISERIPAHLLAEQQEFFLCPRCERIFWKGSHFDRMRQWVEKILS